MMQENNKEIIRTILQWMEESKKEQEIWLCTIISSKGSPTNNIGAMFAYNLSYSVGFLTHPRLDDFFCKNILNKRYFPNTCHFFTLGNDLLNKNEKQNLPTCGTVELLIERISINKSMKRFFKEFLELLQQRNSFKRTINLENGTCILKKQKQNNSQSIIINQNNIEINYNIPIQILILGATPLSKEVAKLCKQMGFDVKICENRGLFLDNISFEPIQNNFELFNEKEGEFIENNIDKYSAVLALAHDKKIEDDALIAAINSNAFFIGALGSIKNNKNREDRLRKRGLSDNEIAKITAPIGIDIGSKTPYEISISIVAQLISLKNLIYAK